MQQRGKQNENGAVSPRYLTRKRAAEYLSISVDTLDRLEERGLLAVHAIPGGCPRYRVDLLDEVLQVRTVKSARGGSRRAPSMRS